MRLIKVDFLKTKRRRKLQLQDIERQFPGMTYADLYHFVHQQQEKGKLEPIKNSGYNGKRPRLYQRYWLNPDQFEAQSYREELLHQLNGRLNINFYLNNLQQYEIDRESVLQLSTFFNECAPLLSTEISINERSYQIWKKEKFLRTKGKRILSNLNLGIDDLNVYQTAEPIAYYARTKSHPQHILIVENMDTYYSLRKHLLGGHSSILGMETGTIIYGGGKKVSKAFGDFSLSAEPYLIDDQNHFWYFGDLDYEGIAIYDQLLRVMASYELKPFVLGYLAMISNVQDFSQLPKTKEGQYQGDISRFLTFFDREGQDIINKILNSGHYIPQEILSLIDF